MKVYTLTQLYLKQTIFVDFLYIVGWSLQRTDNTVRFLPFPGIALVQSTNFSQRNLPFILNNSN